MISECWRGEGLARNVRIKKENQKNQIAVEVVMVGRRQAVGATLWRWPSEGQPHSTKLQKSPTLKRLSRPLGRRNGRKKGAEARERNIEAASEAWTQHVR